MHIPLRRELLRRRRPSLVHCCRAALLSAAAVPGGDSELRVYYEIVLGASRKARQQRLAGGGGKDECVGVASTSRLFPVFPDWNVHACGNVHAGGRSVAQVRWRRRFAPVSIY